MDTTTHKECPICGSRAIEKVFACKDHVVTGDTHTICHCKACGLVFTPHATGEKSRTQPRSGIFASLAHRIALHRRASLIKKLTLLQNGRIVDLGAEDGAFAALMHQRNWSVAAFEKEGQAQTTAKERHGIELHPEEELKNIESNSVDVVTLWDTLGYHKQADKLWSEIHRILDETGIAVISAPNHASYDASAYKEHWAAYDAPRRLWHFTPGSIMKQAEKHGFIMERQYPCLSHGFRTSILSEKNRGRQLSTLHGLWNGFWGLCATMDKCSASSTIIYVFRKKR